MLNLIEKKTNQFKPSLAKQFNFEFKNYIWTESKTLGFHTAK